MLGETLGTYRLIDVIGKGGMGVVYKAEHTTLGRKAAVKLLLPEMSRDSELVDRFFNEARAAATIQHPGLVEVHDFGHHDDGSAYIVMELLHGESLSARLSRETKLQVPLAMAITRQVASALHAAHEHGIIHRDLKPENIFLVPDPDAPAGVRTKVLDFGIAKLSRADEKRSVKTKTGQIFGTPRYMSPEQCKNATNVDARSDIYALGVIIFEMVVGVAPFDYDNWGELIAAHIHETTPKPSELDAGIAPEVEALILRALAKQPSDRFSSMQELAAAAEQQWRSSVGDARAKLFTPPSGIPAVKRGSGPIATAPTAAASGGHAPTLPVAAQVTAPPLERKRPWLAIGAVAAVAIGAGVFMLTRGDRDTPRHAAEPVAALASPDAAVQPEVVPEPVGSAVGSAAPTTVELVIDSTPSGADVYRASDGIKLGKTPLKRTFDRGDGEAEFVIKLAGHRDARVSLPTTKDGHTTAKLTKATKTRPPRGSGSQRGSGGPTVLDPYGGS